ncbi:hypothetical protein HY345_00180 [Candidatus Microgenomates bacterium]|nr:hypothetical protein [Candidatus Microgenomates bacterium]
MAIFFLILSHSSVFAANDPSSVANNRFGIHILFPEELEQAAKLVNSNGGEWGYITIPVRSDDKNLEKWQAFLNKSVKLKIIPILRLATYPSGENWTKPTVFDPLDWANFLDSLEWPVQNRYVVVYNEPNHAQEWGGEVNPEEYSQQLLWTSLELKKRNQDFYVLPAGLDASVPTSSTSLDEYAYLDRMYRFEKGIFNTLDGWNSHSYPNPNFSSSVDNKGPKSVITYAWETDYIKANFGKEFNNIFITETGWNGEVLGKEQVADNFSKAFSQVWNKPEIIAVTPFLLSAQDGPFKKFSWTDVNYAPNFQYQKVAQINKVKGLPTSTTKLAAIPQINIEENSNWSAQKTDSWQPSTKNFVKDLVKFLINE